MYISCIFHVVCATFSALATRKLADANPVSSGIWALVLKIEGKKKKSRPPDWPFFGLPGRQETIYYLRVA